MAETILCVDDEEHVLKVLRTFLERSGYTVRLARDGVQALQSVQEEVPDLVLTDVNMPNLDGLQLARHLRGGRGTAHVPILMLSALNEADQVLSGYSEGADDYVAKPVELAILHAKIESLLKRRGAPQAGDSSGRVVLFLRAKGGVGATTLAVNSAVALAGTAARSLALLDLDLQFGDAARFLGLHPPATLADLSSDGHADGGDRRLEGFLAHHPAGVELMAACDLPERQQLVSVPVVQEAVDWLRRRAPMVLVDTGPSVSDANLAVFDLADLVCVVTSGSPPSLRASAHLLGLLSKFGQTPDRVLLVLNRVSQHGADFERAASWLQRAPDLVVSHSELFDEAATTGRPLLLAHPDNAGCQDLRGLADAITARLKLEAAV